MGRGLFCLGAWLEGVVLEQFIEWGYKGFLAQQGEKRGILRLCLHFEKSLLAKMMCFVPSFKQLLAVFFL